MDFLQELMDSTAELESPRSFFWWAGLTAVSAVVMDNVWLSRGEQEGSTSNFYNLYPNIYVMLHADSAMKKGPPVNLIKDLVKKASNGLPKIISGRSSIQGMLKLLGTAQSVPGGKILNKSAGFIASSEFTSSIVEDRAAMTILTDLYDRNWNDGEWKSLLKMEEFSLKDPILTLLAAINEAHFDDFIGAKDVHGGFMGRMFVIAESQTATFNPLINKLQRVPDRGKLIEHLHNVSKLRGPFASLANTPQGKYYHDWYMDFYQNIRTQKVKDETGTLGRFGDSVLKIALCISLSRSLDLEIDMTTMQQAIEVSEKLITNVRKTTLGKKGKAENLYLKTLIMQELLTREPHMITRENLMKKCFMHYSSVDEFNEVMAVFLEVGMLVVENKGNTMLYIMPDNKVQELQDHVAGKKSLGGA
jgi:hypothetical protein